MNRGLLSLSLALGALTAAATTGALVAIGRRLGAASFPFAVIGASFLERTPNSADAALVALGLLVHVVRIVLWSMIFSWLVSARRHAGIFSTFPAALLVALAALALDWLTAWRMGTGLASVLPLGDRLVLAAVFAVALVAGIRFAFFERDSA